MGSRPAEIEMQTRIERDPIGEYAVPVDAYYGIQTARALENFPISGLRAPAELITATVLIKKAAATANRALGRLDRSIGQAIVAAADEILNGSLREQFVVGRRVAREQGLVSLVRDPFDNHYLGAGLGCCFT